MSASYGMGIHDTTSIQRLLPPYDGLPYIMGYYRHIDAHPLCRSLAKGKEDDIITIKTTRQITRMDYLPYLYYIGRVKEYRILHSSFFTLHFPTPTLLLKVALKRYHSIRGLRHAPC